VITKTAQGQSVDQLKAYNSTEKLGHMKSLSTGIDFGSTKARDMTLYMETDRVKNILRDNELMAN
jgi:hypothetical protein